MAAEQEVARGTGAEGERRAHLRCAVDQDASVLLLNVRQSLRCQLFNLSLGGCRIRFQEPVRIASGAPVELNFKVNGVAFRLSAAIEWHDSCKAAGRDAMVRPQATVGACIDVGVRFTNCLPRQVQDLTLVLSELEARPAPNKTAEFGRPALEQPSRQTPFPAPASQPSISQPPMPTPAPAAAISLPPAGSSRRERRVQTRESVDTSAIVFVVKSGSRLEGRIVDLSPSGCGIRFGERHLRGIYTRVEVEFRLEGLPFRLGGVIQSVRDLHTIGIRFIDLSERKKSQVSELIAELHALHEPLPDHSRPEPEQK